MVVYEDVSETTVRAYSDAGKMIHGGYPEGDYAEAYDPKDAHRTYVETDQYVPTSPTPTYRTFSKLKLYAVLVQAGLWDAMETWLKAQTVDGVNAYTAFSLAQELRDNHPLFASWYAAVKSALGVTDAQAEAILAAAVEV